MRKTWKRTSVESVSLSSSKKPNLPMASWSDLWQTSVANRIPLVSHTWECSLRPDGNLRWPRSRREDWGILGNYHSHLLQIVAMVSLQWISPSFSVDHKEMSVSSLSSSRKSVPWWSGESRAEVTIYIRICMWSRRENCLLDLLDGYHLFKENRKEKALLGKSSTIEARMRCPNVSFHRHRKRRMTTVWLLRMLW